MALETRTLASFDDYGEYEKWIADPNHQIVDQCKHAYAFRHSYIAGMYKETQCGICKAYHPDYDKNFPPIDFEGIL